MQSWSTDDFQDSCRKLGPHNAYPLPPRTKLAWLFSSCNKSNVPGIIPRRQRQPGFTPLQPTRMSVRGSVSQTHTPFISPSSPMGAILWVKQRNSLQVSCSSLLSISRLLLKRKIKQWLAMGTQAQFCWSGTQRGVILTTGAALAIIPCADMVIPAIYCFFFVNTKITCCAACLCPYSGVFFPVHFESTKQGCVQMRKQLVSVTASVVLFWAGIPCIAKALEFWNTWTWHLSLEISQNSLVSRYEEERWKHDFWRSSPKTNTKLKATVFSGCISVKKKHAAGLTGGGMVDGWRWKESRQREK